MRVKEKIDNQYLKKKCYHNNPLVILNDTCYAVTADQMHNSSARKKTQLLTTVCSG